MLRFSVKHLLLAVGALGLLLSSLRFAGPISARVLFDSLLCLLAFSVLLAIYGRTPRRTFWCGFAIFGWIMVGVTQFHVLFAQGNQMGGASVKWDFHPLAQSNLPTTVASRALYQALRPVLTMPPPAPPRPGWYVQWHMRHVDIDQNSSISEAPDGTILASGPGPFYIVDDDFLAVADCWWILFAGGVGGLTASRLARAPLQRGPLSIGTRAAARGLCGREVQKSAAGGAMRATRRRISRSITSHNRTRCR